MKLADLFEANADTLAAIESLDNGKAFSMAKGDVGFAASTLRYYGGWADKIHGKVIDKDPESFVYTKQEPVSLHRWIKSLSLLCVCLWLIGSIGRRLWPNYSLEFP